MNAHRWAALCGAFVLASGLAGGLAALLRSASIDNAAAPGEGPATAITVSAVERSQPESAIALQQTKSVVSPQAGAEAGHSSGAIAVQGALPPERAMPPLDTPPAQVAVAKPDIPDDGHNPARADQTHDDCVGVETCIERYLFSIYERTPKLDTIKVRDKVKVQIKKKGKTRTVVKTVTKLVDEDFTWKDPKAADKAGMPLEQYVIGGMDHGFKLRLYHALRAMDAAGLVPGMTSGFRDDYRQSLASGLKAASDNSYHGGSRHGGYGHGLAADLVSVRGSTRAERWLSSEELWKWIDAHGNEFALGRPYLDKDPPHVAPIDGKEYANHRGRANSHVAKSKTKAGHRLAVHEDHSMTKHARRHGRPG
jgi:hypothetical protein